MTADVVSRLLAAIGETVRLAEAASHTGIAFMWARKNGRATMQAHLARSADPERVLRMCEAHSVIVARYEHARKLSQTAPEPERLLWHTRAIALIDVMDALARGYGVEDGEDR